MRRTQFNAEENREPPVVAAENEMRNRVEALYQEHSAKLVNGLARRTGCRELAAELVQEAFARLLRMAPGQVRSIERPEAFIHRIGANLLRDRARSRAAAERATADISAAARDRVVDQVVVLESRDTLRRLERALAKLKPRTRDIFLLQRIEGLSYAEIAERTGLSVKGVEKQMSKAIAKVASMLDRD